MEEPVTTHGTGPALVKLQQTHRFVNKNGVDIMDVFISPFFGDNNNNSSTNNNVETTTIPIEHHHVTSTIGQDLPWPGTAAATQIRIPAALPPRPAMDLSRPPKINTPTAAQNPARAEFPSSPDLTYEPAYAVKPPAAAPVPAADTSTPASPVAPVLNMLWPFGGLGGTSSSSNSASASSSSRSSSSPALADFAGGGAGEGALPSPSDPTVEALKQRYLAVYNERNELLAEKTARGGDIFAAPAPALSALSDPSSARKLRELEARAQKVRPCPGGGDGGHPALDAIRTIASRHLPLPLPFPCCLRRPALPRAAYVPGHCRTSA